MPNRFVVPVLVMLRVRLTRRLLVSTVAVPLMLTLPFTFSARNLYVVPASLSWRGVVVLL